MKFRSSCDGTTSQYLCSGGVKTVNVLAKYVKEDERIKCTDRDNLSCEGYAYWVKGIEGTGILQEEIEEISSCTEKQMPPRCDHNSANNPNHSFSNCSYSGQILCAVFESSGCMELRKTYCSIIGNSECREGYPNLDHVIWRKQVARLATCE
jgi:hypothetical protein